MPLPFYFQVWTEDGYLSSYTTKGDAIAAARSDHSHFNSYTTVYQSRQREGRPPESTIVWKAA